MIYIDFLWCFRRVVILILILSCLDWKIKVRPVRLQDLSHSALSRRAKCRSQPTELPETLPVTSRQQGTCRELSIKDDQEKMGYP